MPKVNFVKEYYKTITSDYPLTLKLNQLAHTFNFRDIQDFLNFHLKHKLNY